MATIIIRPDGDTTVGNFSNTPINAVLSDSNDATFTNNTSQNLQFTVSLDDVSLSGATFNSFILTTRAKKSGKGNAIAKRANRANRALGTYGNGDGKDAAHTSKNRAKLTSPKGLLLFMNDITNQPNVSD